MNKKEVVAPGREESISLKDNKILPKDIGKKKKPKQISLQKLDLGTNPINIASSNEFLDINNIFNFVKTRIKTILFLIFIIVIFIILFSLKNIIFHQTEEEEPKTIEIKNISISQNNKSPSMPNTNLKPTSSSSKI